MNDDRYTELRKAMVAQQLILRNIRDPKVLKVMESVPRHNFVTEEYRKFAYDDKPVPIGYGQTISQPYIVALMTEVLQINSGEKILEIGTGSGYQSAILSEMGANVFTIEIIPELAVFAEKNLKDTGYSSIKIRSGDGHKGWKKYAPYDAIIVTCAPSQVPQELVSQLKDGGRIVIPVGPENHVQELLLIKKEGKELMHQPLIPVRFVPMTKSQDKDKTP